MPISLCVVTPSFNQGPFIERTIQSVLSQDVPELEYVVMDGGSDDQTLEVLRKHESRLRWVSRPDRGQADAVNQGIRATSGRIIGWLNSDDVYCPGALRAVLEAFQAHPEADVIYGMASHIDQQDRVIEPYPVEPWDLERLKEVCFLCQPAVFFRREVFERFGPLNGDLHYCMDYEYWLRLGIGGARFIRAPELLAGSRFYPQTKTLAQRLKVHKEINDMMLRLLGRVPDRWLLNYAHVYWDTRGLSRDNLFCFALAAAVSSLHASLRWNRAISPGLLRLTAGWVGKHALQRLRRIIAT